MDEKILELKVVEVETNCDLGANLRRCSNVGKRVGDSGVGWSGVEML